MTAGGRTRTYVLSVPANYSADTPQALVFGYPGAGSSGKQSQVTYGLEGPVAAYGQPVTNARAIFVYPDPLVGSNTEDTFDYDDSPTGVDFAFFDALVTSLSSNYCIDSKRIFATGFGAGGTFTNVLGCYRANVLRAIAPVTSEEPSTGGPAQCEGHVAVWMAQGENDPYSSLTMNGIPARDFWLQENACSSTTVIDEATPNACVDYEGCLSGYPVDWCVHDEGHNWPSTSSFICQDAAVCFDAGPAIWSFFSSF
jgi:polyhydroxybutyrate depolymerase